MTSRKGTASRPRAQSRRGVPPTRAEMRQGYQRARVVMASLFVALAVAGIIQGISASPFKAAAAGLILVDSLVRFRSKGVLLALLADAALLGVLAGAEGEIAAPLIAFSGYLLTAALLTLPWRWATLPAAVLAAAAAIRVTVLSGSEITTAARALSLLEVGACTVGLLLVAAVAAKALHLAQVGQQASQLAVQRANDMKSEFVSMVSHELRTPLTNISGFATATQESWRSLDPSEVDEFLTIICQQAEHLRNLVDDVLVAPRLEDGRLLIEPASFPLRPAAFAIADHIFPPRGTKAASVAIAGNVIVHADPNRVEQVLRNLLENARKHGGDQVTVEAVPHQDGWMVVVADNGPGIAEADRDRIFSAFEQAGPNKGTPGVGMGIGLTVCRLLVEAMKGRLWYEPAFPVGARFCFTLPAGQAATPNG
jgi:signal transduction histidine kinase